METESEQNSNSTNGSSSSGGSSRPQISQMSLYERQAVQVRLTLEGPSSVRVGLGRQGCQKIIALHSFPGKCGNWYRR